MLLRPTPAVRRSSALLAALLVFVLALAVRLVGVADAPMHPDEYYTILAARSQAAEGVPRIGEGLYTRAPAFTALIAASLTAFGDSLLAARLPSVLASALVVALAFAWLRREAGAPAAWLLALLLGLSASDIGIAQLSRFYALHALFFLACALVVYDLVNKVRHRWPLRGQQALRASLLLAVAVLCALAAWQLQETTGIGVVALAAWAAVALIATPHLRTITPSRGTWLLLGVGVVAVAVLGVLFDFPGRLEQLYERYRWASLWAAADRDNPRYYVHALAREVPLLVYTFPIALAVALARAPRPAVFCVVVGGVVLLLHSFGGMKAERYIHYEWPLLLAPWAIAGAELLGAVARAATDAWQKLVRLRPTLPRPQPVATGGIAVAAALVVAMAGNPDFQTVRTLPTSVLAAFDRGPGAQARRQRASDEQLALGAIRDVANQGGLLVTSSDLTALWNLGRFDLVLRAGRLSEIEPGQEFARDPRTGAIVISSATSLEQVMECHPAGTMVVWPGDWNRRHRVPGEAGTFIEARMQEIPLPGETGARVFRWSRTDLPSAACPSVVMSLGSRQQTVRSTHRRASPH